MSYQVLARKWRPKSFADMVGQGHVVKALSNALERGQLHHAYLFTGTRGVGKTTLARILSKALNCEQAVSATPCGQCTSCREIDEGRFVDLLEVDAASRTKVDQTRELLDNVPFAPVKGRFKVYLIDEVHMFSAHSFNALLKTLEEPPPHVKFLLATTDPQKVPATVLSRCLQFNLKRLVPEQIAAQFASILEAEDIPSEPRALTLLAHAADGSMRDGLSLLDQAIAFGGGRVTADEVQSMLGTVGRDLCLDLLRALAELDKPGLLDEVNRIAELTPDFAGLLQELIAQLHRIALHQEVPATLGEEDPNRERLLELSDRLSPEDVQLFYQIALLGQQDLPLSPDPRAGIEMILLRMLTFRPESGDESRTARDAAAPPAPARGASGTPAVPQRNPPAGRTATTQPPPGPGTPAPEKTHARTVPPPPAETAGDDWTRNPGGDAAVTPQGAEAAAETAASASHPRPAPPVDRNGLRDPEHWHHLVAELGLGGVASQLANNCELADWDGRRLSLRLAPECRNMQVPSAEERLKGALTERLGEIRLEIRVSPPEGETPARRQARRQAQDRAQAEALMEKDPVARSLQDEFDAQWVPGSIEPRP